MKNLYDYLKERRCAADYSEIIEAAQNNGGIATAYEVEEVDISNYNWTVDNLTEDEIIADVVETACIDDYKLHEFMFSTDKELALKWYNQAKQNLKGKVVFLNKLTVELKCTGTDSYGDDISEGFIVDEAPIEAAAKA